MKSLILILFFIKSTIFAQNYPLIDDLTYKVDKEPYCLNRYDFFKIIAETKEYKELKEMGAAGKYSVRVLVDSLGNVLDYKTVRSPLELVTQMFEKSIKELKFQPAIKDGKTVVCWVNVPLDHWWPR